MQKLYTGNPIDVQTDVNKMCEQGWKIVGAYWGSAEESIDTQRVMSNRYSPNHTVFSAKLAVVIEKEE